LQFNFNYLDIAAILVIGVCAVEGLFRGLVISIFSMIGFVAAIYIGKLAASPVADYLTASTGIDESLNNYFLSKSQGVNLPISQAINTFMGGGVDGTNGLTSILILISAFFIVFLSVRVSLNLIAGMLNGAAKLPVIKQFNSIGGLLLGAIKGVLILYIIFALLTPIIPVLPISNPVVKAIGSSAFAVNFYRYNFIIPWIRGIL